MIPKMASFPAPFTPRPRRSALLVGALLAWGPALPARAQSPAPATRTATSWQDAEQLTVDELARLLKGGSAEKPAMFHVGFRVLFAQAHIPGSKYAGPGSTQAGLDVLRKAVATFPRARQVVLYCGCCPWERCPNMEQPWRMLVAAGFTNVKVLYIPTNFGRDWAQKGHPVESGDPDRG